MPPRICVSIPLQQFRPRWHRQYNLWQPFESQHLSSSASTTPPQKRTASILASLSDNKGAYKPQKRRGRGPASGLGKTSGRGHKGQRQHGKVPAGFEGGQTPQHFVQPKRGFSNVFSKDITPLPLSRIQSWIAQGRLDPTRPITPLQLITSRCVHGTSDGIKLLTSSHHHDMSLDAQPPLSQPLHIVVSQASAQAIAAVEAAGGTVTARYYTRPALRSIMAGRCHPTVSLRTHPDLARKLGAAVEEDSATAAAEAVATSSDRAASVVPLSSGARVRIRTGFPTRLPDPTSRRDLEFYRDAHRRGYLAHELSEGDSPSLYFKSQSQIVRGKRERRAANRMSRSTMGTSDRTQEKKRSTRPGETIKLWQTGAERKL